MKIERSKVFESLPQIWPEPLLPEIRARVAEMGIKIVVLDDDPTGTQTVHDVPVLTRWTGDALAVELRDDAPVCYILTNSRSFTRDQALSLNREIGEQLARAAIETGRDYVVVSRSDSTLRGHFPGEVEALEATLREDVDGWLLIPFFEEGGRFTIGDIHYVSEGEWLTPAGETEFARDAVFGYQASDLKEWVQEKTEGRIPAALVRSITLDTIRNEGPLSVAEKLSQVSGGGLCVVNAASYRDMEVFVMGLLQAEASGKRYLYRTAASFVRVRAGQSPRPLLTAKDLSLDKGQGALFVVGSHVPRTTAQLAALIGHGDVHEVELNVDLLLQANERQAEIERVVMLAEENLQEDEDVVVYTSRKLIVGNDDESTLSIGQRVSESLVSVVQGISARPRYLLAKGGITSSDIATKGLEMEKAMVLGQILPGVPVWRLGLKCRHPGLSYIVFPGNVGDDQALVEIQKSLSAGR